MTFTKLNTIKLLIALFTLFLTACGGFDSRESSYYGGDDYSSPIGDGDDNDDDGEPSYTGGAGVYLRNLHPDFAEVYEKMYFNADLGDVAGAKGTSQERQGGSIIVTGFNGSGRTDKRYFSTAGSTYTTLENNFWTTKSNGDLMWRGIFQGQTGAFIMIVDGVFIYGDGLGPEDTMSGSVWFRPWQVLPDKKLATHDCVLNSQGQWDCKNQSQPLRQCWYISRGPYDCRFNISADGKLVTRLPNPSNDTDWVKIGEFTDLNKSKTFYETY